MIEHRADALVAEAHAQDRDPAGEIRDGGVGDAGVVRRAGPRADDQMGGIARGDLRDRHGVVAEHFRLRAQLAQKLNEVVGEGIVVVDYGDHGCSFFFRPNPHHNPVGAQRRCAPTGL